MVTIKEIARVAGVSRGTVDRVLNGRPGVSAGTSQLVRQVADSLGYRPDLAGQMLAARKKRLRIAFLIVHGPEFVFFQDVLDAAREEARALEKLGVAVDFHLISSFEPRSLGALLDQVLDSKPDGIAALPLRTAPFMRFMEKAAARSIPTVFFNLDEDFAPHLCYVGCDYRRAGRVAAGLCALCAGGEGEVGVLTYGATNSPSFAARMEGFSDELSRRYPRMTLVDGGRPTVVDHGDDPAVADLLHRHGGLKALYIVNLGDFSVCREARRAAGERPLAIITNDLVPAQREMLRDGTISATVVQHPEVQGGQSLQILYEYLVFGTVPRDGKYHTALDIYLPQNID